MISIKHKLHTMLAMIAIFILAITNLLPVQAASYEAPGNGNGKGKGLWEHVPGTPSPARQGAKPAVNPKHFSGYKLNHGGMVSLLATAPKEHGRALSKNALILSLPNPDGQFEDFAIEESPIMEAGLS